MADTQHQEQLDSLDKVSVCLYRFGISLFSISLLVLSASLANLFSLANSMHWALLATSAASALAAANLHVYSKVVRTIIVWSSWLGILLMVGDSGQNYMWLSLGFLFVTFSGIALKESFCFNVTGLKLVPLGLVGCILFLVLDHPLVTSVLLIPTGLIMGYLSYQKWKMPLHFDIGIKAKYQV
ncbi:DUF2301 domain-containing membrane protein [Vibrio taketomensis]|uniref:DUF2301 domain-containing membrane protein n=1 Tax=Vibrio taketomensis TaxID=2572923 RepID=UPI001389A29A|nr:DUF2301 domain-containing membrane protein [Vibrio taketomensis]